MRNLLLIFGACIYFCLPHQLSAQTTVNESSLNTLFNKAHDLFHKEKYAAAQTAFTKYACTGDNALMVSEARYYASICAAELLMNNTEFKVQQFRKEFPENTRVPHSHYKLGEYYFRHKRYHNALEELIEIDAYDLSPYEAEAYYFMTGYCQFLEGNLLEARSYFSEVIDYQNEYYHLANYFHAYVSFENGEYDKALKGFKRIHKHDNFKDFVPIYIAQVYAHNKQYDEVISYCDSIVKNDDLQKRHVVQLLLAQAHFKKGNYEKAEHYYFEYNELRKLGTEDSYQYGYASYMTGDYANSIKQFESFVIEKDSMGQNVSYHLAGAYVHEQKKIEARNSFLFASQVDVDPRIKEESAYNFACLSHELKFTKAAMNGFNDFIKTYPKSIHTEDAKVNLTRILLSSNNYLQAFEMIEKIPNPSKKIDEGYQRLAYNIGLEYLDVYNYVKAREYLNKSLKRAVIPEYKALAFFWIGESLYKQDRYEEALKSYKNFHFVPESKDISLKALAHYNIAYCYIQMAKGDEKDDARYKEALYHFENYLKAGNTVYKKSFDADAHFRIADCYYVLKVYDKALANYESAIAKKYGNEDYALYQMGLIKGLQGNVAAKIDLMGQLMKKHQYSTYMDDAIFQSADEKFLLGNREQALREFEYLNQDFPNNPYFKLTLLKIGIINYQLDNKDASVNAFKKVVSEFPSSKESGEALRAMKDIYIDWGEVEKYYEMIDTIPNIKSRDGDRDSSTFQSCLSYIKKDDCKNATFALNRYVTEFENGQFAMDAYYYMADCYYRNGDFEATLGAYDAIIGKRPNSFSNRATEKAAALCYESDSFARAIKYLELRSEVINDNTDLLANYEALAKCHLEVGSCANAEKYLVKIKAFDDVEADVLQKADYTLARCAMEKGNLNKAISVFNSIAKANENKLGAESKYLVAYLYYTKNELDSSRSTIIELKDEFPSEDYFLAKSFILLADIYAKNEDFFNSKAILGSIIENYTGEDLVTMAKEKLAAVEGMEKAKAIELEEIQKTQEDTIEYNEK